MSDLGKILPPRSSLASQMKVERQYRTALSSANYLKLEVEAVERGLKPFKLAQAIMTLYINKELFSISDLPIDLQTQVKEFYSTQVKIQIPLK